MGSSYSHSYVRFLLTFVFPTAADLVRNDRTASLLEERQAKDERQLQDATRDFRQAFQQPWSRREFDLNDSEHLKTQEGVHMLPGLTGEDTDQQARLKRQRDQLREWSVQQQNELNTARYQQSLEGSLNFISDFSWFVPQTTVC